MPNSNFSLVNPHIEGGFKTVASGQNAQEAAQKVWDRLSGYLTNNLPKFGFTLERVNDKKLFHFVVKESINEGIVDYKLLEHDVNLTDQEIKDLRDKIQSFRDSQNGGKRRHHKADDSSSSEDEDLDLDDSSEVYAKVMRNKFVHQSQPIVYFWYNPLIYRMDYLYVPTFVTPLTPYIQIQLSSAFFP